MLTKIIINRLSQKFYQPIEQARCRKGFITIDHMHADREMYWV